MTLRDFLNVLFKRRYTFLLLLLLFAGGLAAAAWYWPPTWRSVSSLYLRSKRETIDQSLVDNPTINRGISLLLPDVLSEVELVKCADVRRIVIEKLELEREPIDPRPGAPRLAPDLQRAAWDGYLYDNVLVEAAPSTNVINVTVTDARADRAARIASAYADAYLEFRRSLVARSEPREGLEGELDTAAKSLHAAEGEIGRFDAEWNLVDASAQKTELIDLLSRTRSQIADDRAALERSRRDHAAYVELASAGAPELQQIEEVRTNTTCQSLESQLAALKIELASLLQHNQDTADPVVRVRESIATLEQALKEKSQAILQSILFAKKAEADSIEAGLKVQEQLAASVERELDVLRSKAIMHDRLTVDLELSRDRYKMVSRRLNERHFEDLLKGTGNVDVLIASHGSVPQRPYFPPPFALCAIVALLIGLVVAFSAVLVLDLLDQTFKTPDEIEQQLGAEVLATIPKSRRHRLTQLLGS